MEGEPTLTGLPTTELLARFAARTAAPGGGSAAATGCALAAALVEMAARFDVGPAAQTTAARAGELRAAALTLAERDSRAFAPVLEASALPIGDERSRRVAAARSRAVEPPLEIAVVSAEVAGLGAESALHGNPNLTGDSITAVLLAEASCRAAAELVELNLEADEDPRHERAAEAARDAAEARLRALTASAPAEDGRVR